MDTRALPRTVGGLALVAGLTTSVFSSTATAHGYTTAPASRAYACQQGHNSGCGAAQYEPQSVGEAPKGFPQSGPADGKLASGGIVAFAELDVQSANRWHRTPVAPGAIEFAWFYTAGHNTTRWEYFITRPDWNPNAPLARASFDTTPFCTVEWNASPPFDLPEGSTAPGKEKHLCQLPADRAGHHVIYGAWTVDNTPAAFYNVMDVEIAGEAPGDGWATVGSINPQRELQVGDKVSARVFVAGVEAPGLSTGVSIQTAAEGLVGNWSFKLAEQINQAQVSLKAGVRDSDGKIAPVRGNNTLFAQPASGISSVELAYELVPGDGAYMQVHGLKPNYTLSQGKALVDFTLQTNARLNVSATLFDATQREVGAQALPVQAGSSAFAVPVQGSAGAHLLKLVGIGDDGRVVLQQEHAVQLSAAEGEYAHVYPQGISTYRAGVRVLHAKTGAVFECRPFPNEGWCRIESPAYEPGLGSAWQDAWIAR